MHRLSRPGRGDPTGLCFGSWPAILRFPANRAQLLPNQRVSLRENAGMSWQPVGRIGQDRLRIDAVMPVMRQVMPNCARSARNACNATNTQSP